jgi:hypothetical protein
LRVSLCASRLTGRLVGLGWGQLTFYNVVSTQERERVVPPAELDAKSYQDAMDCLPADDQGAYVVHTHTWTQAHTRTERAWRESRYVPVLVTGFEGLRERVQKQDELRDGHKAALHQISGNVDRLRAELQARVLTKLSERQQQHRALVQRMLEVRPHTASARACVCVNLFLSLTRGTGGQAAGDGATAAHARLG